MPEAAFLRDDVHAVRIDDDLVILDVAADRYICLPAVGAVLSLSEDRSRVAVSAPELFAELSAAGLFQNGAGRSRRPPPPPPSRSVMPSAFSRPPLGDAPEILLALFDLARCYRGRALAEILAVAAPAARRAEPRWSSALEQAVVRGLTWAPYAPVSAQCLVRSFMLLRTLRRQDLDALWVFGVRTWPFHAHCWLQADDVVLDDHAERVAAYAPILVV